MYAIDSRTQAKSRVHKPSEQRDSERHGKHIRCHDDQCEREDIDGTSALANAAVGLPGRLQYRLLRVLTASNISPRTSLEVSRTSLELRAPPK